MCESWQIIHQVVGPRLDVVDMVGGFTSLPAWMNKFESRVHENRKKTLHWICCQWHVLRQRLHSSLVSVVLAAHPWNSSQWSDSERYNATTFTQCSGQMPHLHGCKHLLFQDFFEKTHIFRKSRTLGTRRCRNSIQNSPCRHQYSLGTKCKHIGSPGTAFPETLPWPTLTHHQPPWRLGFASHAVSDHANTKLPAKSHVATGFVGKSKSAPNVQSSAQLALELAAPV